jgi:hypothetical protein
MRRLFANQSLELVNDRHQPVHGCLGSKELAVWAGRVTAEHGAGRHVPEDAALGCNSHPIPDNQMIRHTDVTRDYHVISDPCTSCDSDSCHDQTPLSDPDVMSDLNQIVHLGATPDDCVVDAAAIDAGVGTDLHLILEDAAADMWDTGVSLAV